MGWLIFSIYTSLLRKSHPLDGLFQGFTLTLVTASYLNVGIAMLVLWSSIRTVTIWKPYLPSLGNRSKSVRKKWGVTSVDSSDSLAPSLDQSTKPVAHHLNSKLHEQAEFKNTDMYKPLSISSLIKDTDPVLLQFIKQLTFTVHESRHRLFDTEETGKKLMPKQSYSVHYSI